MTDAVLALNAGSSSLKFAVFRNDGTGKIELASKGEIEGIGTAPHFVVHDANGTALYEMRWPDGAIATFEGLLGALLFWVDHHLGDDRLVAVGHRVVHGGATYTAP